MLLTLNNSYDVSVYGFSYASFFGVDFIDWNAISLSIILLMVSIYFWLEFLSGHISIMKMLYTGSMVCLTVFLAQRSIFEAWILLDLQHLLVSKGLVIHMYGTSLGSQRRLPVLRFALVFCLISVALAGLYYYVGYFLIESKNAHLFFISLFKPTTSETVKKFFFCVITSIAISGYYWDRLLYKISDKDIGPITKGLLLGRPLSPPTISFREAATSPLARYPYQPNEKPYGPRKNEESRTAGIRPGITL
jgi:hypothetical protein